MCLVTLNLIGLHIYQDSSKPQRALRKKKFLGNTVTDNYLRVTKQAYRGASMAAQLTSNCGRPSAVNLTAHIPVPKVAPAI